MEILENIRDGNNEPFEWFYFLALALILAFGTITTTGTALDTEKPVVSVVSCSMYPEYHKGDILVVQGQNFSDIEERDVAIYKVPDRIDFTLNGESYTLEENSPDYNTTVDTEIGEIELLEVTPDLTLGEDRNRKENTTLRVNGEIIHIEEGNSKEGIEINRASAMPIPVVHRVIEKNEGYVQTKGDYNDIQLDFESDVRPFQIHGTTAFKIPRLGVVKILAMDLVGFQGDQPLVIDRYRPCR